MDEEHEFGFVGALFDGDGIGEVGCYRVVGGGVGYAVVLEGDEDNGGGGGRHCWHPLWMMMVDSGGAGSRFCVCGVDDYRARSTNSKL